MASLDLQNSLPSLGAMDKTGGDHLNHNTHDLPTSSYTTYKSTDIETQQYPVKSAAKQSAFQSLGWLDRLLALWILLAIIIGIVLGNYVPGIEAALQRGKFVDVSVPIGKSQSAFSFCRQHMLTSQPSVCWS